PSVASRRAIVRPKPRSPPLPVTTATLPSRRSIKVLLAGLSGRFRRPSYRAPAVIRSPRTPSGATGAACEGGRVSATPLGWEPVPGRVRRMIEIPARHGAALEVARGLVLRVIDVEGQQVGDFVCFNRDD